MTAIPDRIARYFLAQYECEPGYTYFAGGHEWSDGVVYQTRQRDRNVLLKIVCSEDGYARLRTQERLAYMDYLSSKGVNTLTPLHTLTGELVPMADAEYTAHAWFKLEGEHHSLSDPRELQDFYYKWGSLVGRMHALSKEYPSWEHSRARDLQGKPILSKDTEWLHFYHWIPDPEVKQAWLVMKEKLDLLPRTRENFGFIHNDPHPQNMLLKDDELYLIDFDVANYHWYILELAICIYSEYSRVQYHSNEGRHLPHLQELFIKPFLQGYKFQNTLPDEEFTRLELFLNYRRFIMFTVFYEQIKTNAPEVLARMKEDIIAFKPFLGFEVVGL